MLTDEQKRDYERAAVALENGDELSDIFHPDGLQDWEYVAWMALLNCEMKRLVAALLLRECIANGVLLAAVDGTRGEG